MMKVVKAMKMKDKFEQRAYAFELRAEQDAEKGIAKITGRPIIYESKTDLGVFDEIIARGALNGANLKDVRFLVNHNTSMIPLARSRNNNENSTMQLMPDDDGMAIRVNLDVANNSDAKNLASAIERGDITGMSFMFAIGDEEWKDIDSDHPTRIVKKISNVVEVSAVTFPAYEATEIHVRNKAALDNARAALESAKASRQDSTADELALAKAKIKLIGVI